MANINQLITLGIGTPSGIKEFLTFGLQIDVLVTPTTVFTVTLDGRAAQTFTLPGFAAHTHTLDGKAAEAVTLDAVDN